MEVISSIYNSGYNIKKFYLGSQELNLAYLGNQVIYDEVIGDNDLNYILYEFYGSDTLPNTVEAPVKGATLSGNTLVNIFDVALPTEIKNNHDITLSYQVNANETYTFIVEAESTSEKYQGGFITANGGGNGWNGFVDNGISKFTVTTSEATNKVRFSAYGASNTVQIKKCMIIKGDYSNQDIPFFTGMQSVKVPVLTTSNEDGTKTNILTVNEEVELRGIGDIKDELDLLTGELTQKIGEIILDGDESWSDETVSNSLGYKRYSTVILNNEASSSATTIESMNNALHQRTYEGHGNFEYLYVQRTTKGVKIYINSARWNSATELNSYLLSNPITIQYQLKNQSVKTVDLTIVDQDGKTINKLNSFNGTTHVSTEVAENSAYPMVSLEVASELQTAMSKVAEDIELIKPVQNDIETTLDTQSNDIDSLLLATTELFEMFL